MGIWYDWDPKTDKVKQLADYALDDPRWEIAARERERRMCFDYFRRIASYRSNGYWISSVFLFLDHGFRSSKPVLFETAVFADGYDELFGRRHYTAAEARNCSRKLIHITEFCFERGSPQTSKRNYRRIMCAMEDEG